MSEHLKTTLLVLTQTKNEAAVRVLIAALDSRWRMIREEALLALLARRSPAGHREVIRRLAQLDETGRAAVRQCRGRMTQALRDAILSTEELMCRNGCEVVLWLREYDLMPTLLSALADPSNPNALGLAETLRALTDSLYEECSTPQEVKRGQRDPQAVRASLLTALETSVNQYAQHRRREPIESFLVLAEHDHPALRQILENPYHPAFVTVIDVLTNSPRPGIMRLLLNSLDDPGACLPALSLIGRRTDTEFVHLLMERIGRSPSSVVARNLKRIEHIAWLSNAPHVLIGLDDADQAIAVRFVVGTSVSRAQAFGVVKHLLIYGKREGRRAAAAALAEFSGVEANDLAIQALSDEDPIVQAEVIPRLRGRGIPGVVTRLFELTDSPHESVRKAIRESLDEFSFERYVNVFEMLDDEMRYRTGMLAKRIDPTTIPRLREELHSDLRTRRLRAMEIMRVIEAQEELESDLISMLRHDPDHLVRVEAAELLGESGSLAARAALRAALADPSTAVCETARRALNEPIHQHP